MTQHVPKTNFLLTTSNCTWKSMWYINLSNFKLVSLKSIISISRLKFHVRLSTQSLNGVRVIYSWNINVDIYIYLDIFSIRDSNRTNFDGFHRCNNWFFLHISNAAGNNTWNHRPIKLAETFKYLQIIITKSKYITISSQTALCGVRWNVYGIRRLNCNQIK